jgi:hypothetical protein
MHEHWLNALWNLNLAATVALALNLVRTGLVRVYRFLFVYLAADIAQTVSLMLLKNHRKYYAWTYVHTQPIKVILAIFVILELYRVALAQRPALARFGRNTVGYILAAAAVGALSLLMLDSSVPPGQPKVLHDLYSFERTMDEWLLFFLIVIRVFMTWFPVRMTRNGAIYIAAFAVYFLARSAGLLLVNVMPIFRDRFDVPMLSVSFVCLMAWLFALRREGEQITVVTGPRRDPERMRHLTQQLDAMNARLAEIGRRQPAAKL